MKRVALGIAAALVVLGMGATGGWLGAWIGDSVCRDPADEWFRCMDEAGLGALIGFLVGICAGFVLVALMPNRISARCHK